MTSSKDSEWLYEFDSPFEGHVLKIRENILSAKTKYQKLDLVETYAYGTALFLDGKIQSSEADSFIYHEALVVPPLIIHPRPEKILIIGGGEGSTLRQVLQVKGIKCVVMVDIDGELVSLTRKHLSSFCGDAFSDPRVELRFEDGRKYLEAADQIFDVVIVDATEPIEKGPSYLLYTEEFYRTTRSKLAVNGIIATQAGFAKIGNLSCLLSVRKTLAEVFSKVRIYTAFVPCYSSAWGFALASDTLDPLAISGSEVDSLIDQRCKEELKFYDGECHHHMFSVPKYLRPSSTLREKGKVITDDAPLFIP
jgi:spermidine synthase